MYKVTTGEARTDLYDINKGLAQVVDLSITRENQLQDKQIAASEKAAKKKSEQARESDIMNNFAVLSKIAIRPNDQQYFAEQQKGLYDYVEKNIDKLKEGDPASAMEFQRMFGKLTTEAEISKNAREFAEAELQKAYSNPTKYRADSDKRIGGFLADPKYAGNWDVSQVPLKENIDYRKRIEDTLAPIADDIMVKTPMKSVFSSDDAKKLIKDDVMSDPMLIDQANYEFELAKERGETKETDPIEYFANKNSQYLTRNKTGSAFYTGFDGAGNSNKKPQLVATTVVTNVNDPDNNWESTVDYADKSDPYQALVRTVDGQTFSQDVKVNKFIKRGGKTVVQVSSKPTEGGVGEVFEVDYEKGGKELLRKMGVSNPYSLRGKGKSEDNISIQTYEEKSNKNETKGGNSTYDASTEAKIKAVMDKNKASRETVIAALKKAGKIK